MSDEKFEIPSQFASPANPEVMSVDTVLRFNCHKGISCFNACCRMADVTLAPYDILRLQRRLGMSSEEFLQKHGAPFHMDKDGMPGLKMRTDDSGACLFMDPENGCSVYEDRPTVCRYYPLALLSMREKDSSEAREQYSLIREPHCMGHQEAREITIGEYRKEQGVEEYDDLNREWYRLILKRKSAGPGVGTPNEMSLQLFFMASYNFDMLRRFVLSENFRKAYDVSAEELELVEKDDVLLLQLGYRLMRQALFGEKTIAERSGEWERRVAERRQIWEARTAAEIEARNTKLEGQMREET